MRSLATALFLSSTLLASSALAVTGSGTKLKETRKISDFTEIEVSDGITLDVQKGATSLTIEGDDNLVPLYTTEVVKGRLRIHRATRESVRTKLELVVRVTTPSLKRIEASGGVDATLDGVAAKDFEATLSGGVDFKAQKLDLDTLALEASGGVELTLAGKAKSAKVQTSGGVNLKGKGLEIAQLTVDASGGCSLDVTARESITGEVSGGVGVTVYGNPPKSRVRTSPGASVDYVD